MSLSSQPPLPNRTLQFCGVLNEPQGRCHVITLDDFDIDLIAPALVSVCLAEAGLSD